MTVRSQGSTPFPRASVPTLLLLFFGLAGFLVYGRLLGFGFVSVDDQVHLYENPYFRPFGAASWARFWSEPLEGLFVPLTYTLWSALLWLGRQLTEAPFGLHPGLLHGANVSIHFLNTALVYRLLARLSPNYEHSRLPALAGAALFAFHPLQVEAVAWVSSLKDLLSGCLVLCAYNLWLSCPGQPLLRLSSPGPRFWAAIALCFAILAKPSTAVAPLGILCLEIARGRRPSGAALAFLTPALLLAGWAIRLTWDTQGVIASAFALDWTERLRVASDSLGFYLTKQVWPSGLSIDYGRTPKQALVLWTSTLPVTLAYLGLLGWSWLARWEARIGLTLLGIALLPNLGLVGYAFQIFSTVADRYCYLSLVGAAYAFAAVLRLTPRALPLSLLPFALAIPAHFQTLVWSDSETLYRRAISVNDESIFALHGLTELLISDGHTAEARKNLDVLFRKFPQAGLFDIRSDQGLIELLEGQPVRAARFFREALAMNPSHVEALNNLGVALESQSRPREAAKLYAAATDQFPHRPEPRYNLARLQWASLTKIAVKNDQILADAGRATAYAPELQSEIESILAGPITQPGHRAPAGEGLPRPKILFGLGLPVPNPAIRSGPSQK